jgi:sulfite exporter TauE/SafE
MPDREGSAAFPREAYANPAYAPLFLRKSCVRRARYSRNSRAARWVQPPFDVDPGLLQGLTFGGGLLAGLGGAIHCGLMCGPLAAAAARREGGTDAGATATYQLGRLAAYAGLGAIVGASSSRLTALLPPQLQQALPWLLALLLAASALELGGRIGRLPLLARPLRAVHGAARALPPLARGGLMGLATPLLPCGLSYGLFATALASGSAATGASLLAGFAIGGAPALLAAQGGLGLLDRLGGPAHAHTLRKLLPLLGAAVLVWRALHVEAPDCH